MKKHFSNILTGAIIGVALYFIYDYAFNREPKFIIGEKAPNFSAKRPDGSTLQLADYQGKIVLLDFWGTWCGPCIAEISGLVYLHQKYANVSFPKAKGFAIVSVAMDKDKEKWESVIKNRGMNWESHVSDLKRMGGAVGKLYRIREIPTKYLLNEEGIIISVNPSIQEIDAILSNFKGGKR